jgi:hypothetical protein
LVFGPKRIELRTLIDNGKRIPCAGSCSAKPLLGLVLTIILCLGLCSTSIVCLPGITPSDGEQTLSPSNNADALVTSLLSFVANPTRAYVGDTITFYANASSDVSSTLVFTIFFDSWLADYTNNTASPSFTTTTANPGNVVTTFSYDHIGNVSGASGTYFKVRVYVGDGTDTVTAAVSVYIVENAAPVFSLKLPSSIDISPGVETVFTTVVADVDDDSLTVTWDFGDGSEQVVNVTGPAADGISVTQSHAWNPYIEPGTGDYFIYFWMNITVDDGQGHSVMSTTRLNIYIPWNWSPVGDFYTNSTVVDPADVVMLFADATDFEGDPLTWTYVFSNATTALSTEVYHTPSTSPNSTVWMNITHTFDIADEYTVTLWLSDAVLPELQVFPHNLSKEVKLTSVVNSIPYVMANITFAPQLIYYDPVTGVGSALLSTMANDLDGDVLTVTWDFGDGSAPATNMSAGGRQVYEFIQAHDYSSSGIYSVTCTVTDSRAGHDVVRTGNLTIRSNNSAPLVRSIHLDLSNGDFAVVNSTVTITLILSDAESDPIDLWWYFGDNSSLVHASITEFDEDGNGSCEMSHSYNATGSFRVRITFSDNMFDYMWHNSSWNVTVDVREMWIAPVTTWDSWDYASLGMFIGVFVLMAGYGVYAVQFRKKLDKKGLSYEEYKILKQDQAAKRKAERAKKTGDAGKGKSGGLR